MDWRFVGPSSPNSYVEGNADGLRRWWPSGGLEEVIRGLHDGISALMRKDSRGLVFSPSALYPVRAQ